MRQFVKTAVTFGVLVVLIFGFYAFANWFSKTTGYVLGEDEKIKLAQCLSGKGAVFYTSSTCPVCESQIMIFGETASKFLTLVECNNPEECPDGGVPAWEINDEIYYGLKGFEELSEISECRVE